MQEYIDKFTELGLVVVGKVVGDKRPIGGGWQNREVTVEDLILMQIERGESDGICLVMGKPTNQPFFAIDIDDNGLQSVEEKLAEYRSIQEPYVIQKTPSGGYHLIYPCAKEDVPATAKNATWGIDIRGRGGQVVAAPTHHKYTEEEVTKGKPAEGDYTVEYVNPVRENACEAILSKVADVINSVNKEKGFGEFGSGKGNMNEVWEEGNRRDHFNAALWRAFGNEDKEAVEAAIAKGRESGLTDEQMLPIFNSVQNNSDKALTDDEYGIVKPSEVAKVIINGKDMTPKDEEEEEVKEEKRDKKLPRIYRMSELEDEPPPKWLVDSIIPDEAYTILYGDSNVGKTFVAVDIACKVADTDQVIYCALEDHKHINVRAKAWYKHKGVTNNDNLYYVFDMLDISSSESVNNFVKAIKVNELEPKLIVVDTLASSFHQGDENNASDISKVNNHVRHLITYLRCAVMVVHHTGKDESKGMRGSSAIRAAVDMAIHVKEHSDGFIQLICNKSRHSAKFEDVSVQLATYGSDCVATIVENLPKVVTKKGQAKSKNLDKIVSVLNSLGAMTAKDIMTATDMSRTIAFEALKYGIEAELLTKDSKGIYAVREAF